MRVAKVLAWGAAIAGAAFVVVVTASVIYGYSTNPGWVGVADKKLWDWLDLLIVPLVLGVGGYLFTRSENRNAQALAEQRAQDEALENYVNQMSQLLIDKGEELRNAQLEDHLSIATKARTLAVLRRLDGMFPLPVLT